MLLNYLYSNFYEETNFAVIANSSRTELEHLINLRVMPSASYVIDGNSQSISFVSSYKDTSIYRFHLKGHLDWIKSLLSFDLGTEERAKGYFEERYRIAQKAFLLGRLGKTLATFAPDIPQKLGDTHFNMTWNHFLDGVYGVCTRDGQPETIFLKQISVMFIERIVSEQHNLSSENLNALKQAVSLLDNVESEFAPHEVSKTSRQRCIVDVRLNILKDSTL